MAAIRRSSVLVVVALVARNAWADCGSSGLCVGDKEARSQSYGPTKCDVHSVDPLCVVFARNLVFETGLGVRHADGITLVTWVNRWGVSAHGLYTVFEAEPGIIVAGAPLIATDGSLHSATSHDVARTTLPPSVRAEGAWAGYLVVGLRPTFDNVSLAIEGAVGVRALCGYPVTSDDDTVWSRGRGLVEGRLRGDYWLSRMLTIGVTAGTSVLGREDWTTTVQFGVHARRYDKYIWQGGDD